MARPTAAQIVSRTAMPRPSAASSRRLRARLCGTTDEFCNDDCQSNCDLHPDPPAGSASAGVLENKVIGYYESWSARKDCHKVSPMDLPLDALTHVNFAFAYIEPESYKVVTMDQATPASLFEDTTSVKAVKEQIKIFVSIGGWTFSDNDTSTQPLFGEISADPTKRTTFANNVVRFMKQYGFDGVDLDWEYPGAPDRGGNPEDTENYVLLLKTLREVFDASGGDYGITFTAPSSYWYLRWFDLPSMVEHVDWINLMTYDLHGVWDSTNPIGSIVQAHTNLTEIKLATELFWRVGIPPAKLVMGFGFYGRSFTLANPDCTKPGCPFSGASSPGPCSATGGILTYYEIMAALKEGSASKSKRAAITPVHDKDDAVKYFIFDDDQWISYDDETTFKQKVDWANSVGLGGAMIWASDQDTDKYDAHAALIQRDITTNPTLQNIEKALSNPSAVIDNIAAFNGQKCFQYDGDCIDLDDNSAMADACGAGFTVVGWDDAGCGKSSCHCGKPVCCPTSSAPKNCIWRGDDNGGGAGTDCSAQCRAGEINIKGIRSSWGGGFLNDGDTDKCGRGYKVFCCPDPDYAQLTKGCSYAGCGDDCPSGSTSVFKKYDKCWSMGQNYCCPTPVSLSDCHWEAGSGGGDCANANCGETEVEVDRSTYGDKGTGCDWGRQQAMCCTVTKAPIKSATCSVDLCTKTLGYCPATDNDGGSSSSATSKRDLTLFSTHGHTAAHTSLQPRAGGKTYYIKNFRLISMAYPSSLALLAFPPILQVLREWFRIDQGPCLGRNIEYGYFSTHGGSPNTTGLEVEHPIDRQVLVSFFNTVNTQLLPSGQFSRFTAIDGDTLRSVLHAENEALAARPPIQVNPDGVPVGVQPDSANDRLFEALGSNNYPYPFSLLEKQVNAAKGRLMGGKAATAVETVRTDAKKALESGEDIDINKMLQDVRIGISIFDYLNEAEVSERFNAVRHQVRLQAGYVEQDVPQLPDLAARWEEFFNDFVQTRQEEAQV
ncbi:glycoside hydrolase superfamily [Aspergillus similis]